MILGGVEIEHEKKVHMGIAIGPMFWFMPLVKVFWEHWHWGI